MKLQINTAGAWRDVCRIRDSEAMNVTVAAVMLARAIAGARFAIVDDDGKRRWFSGPSDRDLYKAANLLRKQAESIREDEQVNGQWPRSAKAARDEYDNLIEVAFRLDGARALA